MSGHSKWTQIKRQKGASDIKRGNIFTKLSNTIALTAKRGGTDPAMNSKLREALDAAKNANMPSSTIDRALKRASSKLEADNLDEVLYEAYGPQGIAFWVKTITNNRNRTSQELRHIFSKGGGGLAGPGAVSWMRGPDGEFTITVNEADDDAMGKVEKITSELEELDDVTDFDCNLVMREKNEREL